MSRSGKKVWYRSLASLAEVNDAVDVVRDEVRA